VTWGSRERWGGGGGGGGLGRAGDGITKFSIVLAPTVLTRWMRSCRTKITSRSDGMTSAFRYTSVVYQNEAEDVRSQNLPPKVELSLASPLASSPSPLPYHATTFPTPFGTLHPPHHSSLPPYSDNPRPRHPPLLLPTPHPSRAQRTRAPKTPANLPLRDRATHLHRTSSCAFRR